MMGKEQFLVVRVHSWFAFQNLAYYFALRHLFVCVLKET